MNIDSALPNLREMVQMRLAELTQRGQKAIDQEKDKNKLSKHCLCSLTGDKMSHFFYRRNAQIYHLGRIP